MSRTLGIAVSLSLLLHLMVLTLASPAESEWPEMQVLTARLLPALPAPLPRQKPAPSAAGVGSAAPPPSSAETWRQELDPPAIEAPPAEESPQASAPDVPLPKLEAEGGILYAVYLPPAESSPMVAQLSGGDAPPAAEVRGMEIGRARHRWRFADGRYELRSEMETSGLAAVFRTYRMAVESRGRLTAAGLQPDSYRTWRNGQVSDESIDFDWEKGRVALTRVGQSLPLAAGTQDLLSLHYHLAYLPELTAGGALPIATARKVSAYRLEFVGDETIEIPAGVYLTRHLRVKTDSTTDLWLATERQLLPVKIRYTDRKGSTYELQAVAIGKFSS